MIFKRVKYKGFYLPSNRTNEGLRSNKLYIRSAADQISKIKQYCTVDNKNILDFGCGPGRLASYLLISDAKIASYYGIDADIKSINWVKRWIEPGNDKYKFMFINAHNERYNPTGQIRPFIMLPEQYFNIVFINSVFSHMLPEDIQYYLEILSNAIIPGGLLYLTAFTEPNVEKFSVNPPGYLGRPCSGPLHRVRYNDKYLQGLVSDLGYRPLEYDHRGISRTGQSELLWMKE